jgi:hypothetical protein
MTVLQKLWDTHTDFVVYCIEEYKFANNMNGKQVIELFNKYDIINYIYSCYGALHTMGGLAISDDINLLIDEAKRNNQ